MKTKQIILTIALFFATFVINAQDKYEFMIIDFNAYLKEISVSIDGKEFIKRNVSYIGQEKTPPNANPFLTMVSEYQDKGWEVLSFNSSNPHGANGEVHFAHLRKKKADTK